MAPFHDPCYADGMGRVTIETNELADSRSFYYDSLGRMTRRVDRNERVMQFEYDLLDVTAQIVVAIHQRFT